MQRTFPCRNYRHLPPRNRITAFANSTKRAALLVALASSTSSLLHHRGNPFFSLTKQQRVHSLSMSSSQMTNNNNASRGMQNDAHKKTNALQNLYQNFDSSWIRQLHPETDENRIRSTTNRGRASDEGDMIQNKAMRPVHNGHYVRVRPTALKNPRLVVHSSDMARRLGLSEEYVRSREFLQFFSGDVDGALERGIVSDDDDDESSPSIDTWATPYALSIMGTRYTNNCPFGTGDGYGDGRAISIAEVLLPTTTTTDDAPVTESDRLHTPTNRYELQLKGGGTTPFCRGADGRAVLRSSIREFLASEAMYHLGIPTTRALSLIVSSDPNGDTSRRPWYSADNKSVELPSMDDPRLARYSVAERKQILMQLSALRGKNDPDIMIQEPCAITTRVSPSFVRVGHLDLFSRRVTSSEDDVESREWKELVDILWHAAYREFPDSCYDPFKPTDDVYQMSRTLLSKSMEEISNTVSDWIRVGFVQGNFNADNCLVGGRTMDYGPFGFVEEYNPLYAKWTGSGEHFGFMNQLNAGYANFAVMVESVMPIIDHYAKGDSSKVRDEIMAEARELFQHKMNLIFRRKLGFHSQDDAADDLWPKVEVLLRDCRTDWTLFWRQLTYIARQFPVDGDTDPSKDYEAMLDVLIADKAHDNSSPFYDKLTDSHRNNLQTWIQSWRESLVQSAKSTRPKACPSVAEQMRLANPKFVLREWMLVGAYNQAAKGDYSTVKELLDLIQNPYDEGTEDQSRKYYRRASEEALTKGGTAFMS